MQETQKGWRQRTMRPQSGAKRAARRNKLLIAAGI
jgi:hypothetical protein